jgi:hypothetical protein
MKEYYIRQDLPSVRVDKSLIEQLENYILFDVPSIIKVDNQLVLKNYSIEIVDSLGTGKFNRISEFPASMFQNGTEKIQFGTSIYEPYFRVQISFSKRKYYSAIDISLKSDNPSEIAKGIYNEILTRINQHKTYNSIYHNEYLNLIGAASFGIMIGGIILLYSHFNHWGFSLYITLLLISFIAAKGQSYKPYSEFSTAKQLQINKTFNYIVLSIIIPLIVSIFYDIINSN